MRFKAVIAGALMMPAVAMAWPWSTDMMNQPSIKPQEGTMLGYPEGVMPVGGIPTKVSNREETRDMVNPIKATPESLKKGRDLYKIYCAACHGRTGRGGEQAPVGQKIGAIPLNNSYVTETLTEGWLWGTITFGSYVMPAYGVPQGNRGSNDMNVEERWHLVNYLKNGLMEDDAKETRTASAE